MKKIIFVTGGVVSSIGKGILSASIGVLLQGLGLKIKIKKLDPYINVDPGLMNPYEHGEVFVTKDGKEVDLDFGHYERFLGIESKGIDNITTGKIYSTVINKERKNFYKGKTVQIIPHITDAIKEFIQIGIEDVDVLICEIGGTIGDIESLPFIEAARQLSNDKNFNFLSLHICLLPYLQTTQEIKTKPCQQSVRMLASLGLNTDILVCRTYKPTSQQIKEKISLMCNIDKDSVIEAKDIDNIHDFPIYMSEQKLEQIICRKLSIFKTQQLNISHWYKLKEKRNNIKKQVNILIAGKYIKVKDSYKSLIMALEYAGYYNNVKTNIVFYDTENELNNILDNIDGIIIPGGFGNRAIENKIEIIKTARQKKIPCLGICLGMQLMIIEYAKNVLNIKDANSEEYDKSLNNFIVLNSTDKTTKIEENSINMKGDLRLGEYKIYLKENSKIASIYNSNIINERHRHRYIFNNKYEGLLKESKQVQLSAYNKEKTILEVFEYINHPWMIGVQYHPEFKSKVFTIHPLFNSFIKSSKKYNIFII